MNKTKISEIRQDRTGKSYGVNAAGQLFFPSGTQVLKVGDWITFEASMPTKRKINPALPSTPDNLRDLTADEARNARSSNRVLAIFPDVQSLAKGLSTDKEADLHIDAYSRTLTAEIKEMYKGAFEAVTA